MARAKVSELSPAITANPHVRFGKPVIAGTRVDVATVLGHLAAGDTVEVVMHEYGLTREQVAAALDYAARIVEDEAEADMRLHDEPGHPRHPHLSPLVTKTKRVD